MWAYGRTDAPTHAGTLHAAVCPYEMGGYNYVVGNFLCAVLFQAWASTLYMANDHAHYFRLVRGPHVKK